MLDINPEQLFLAAFWRCIYNDLMGRGCTLDSSLSSRRRLPYVERVKIERMQLQTEAQAFIDSPDFQWWVDQSGIDSTLMRTKLHGADAS